MYCSPPFLLQTNPHPNRILSNRNCCDVNSNTYRDHYPKPYASFAGVFAIKFYPPLVLDYPTDHWVDISDYDTMEMMVNFLQSLDLKTYTIGPMGPSGYYPDSMKDVTVGSIIYQALLDQKTTTGNSISYYFAISTSNGGIEIEVGTPHFYVQSNLAKTKIFSSAAEEVLATLLRASQPIPLSK